jgi:hypothetical protein
MFDKDVGVNWHLKIKIEDRRITRTKLNYLNYEEQIT